ncbi:MAG: hypothetical protein FWG11_03960, partial [Promicromonosporaceae bacterium]|nr:hypothetical protein [Promicromonosporaceae bacterium]
MTKFNINFKYARLIVFISCLLLLVFAMLLLPQVRQMIIKVTERFIVSRELANHLKWHDFLFNMSIL